MKQKNDKLIEREEIESTPFIAMKQDEKWYCLFGKYRMTNETFDSVEEIIEWLEDEHWNIIATMAGIIAEFEINKFKNNGKQCNTRR